MSFKNFVCWKPDQVRRVMDTEALQTPDHIFLATHNPIMMYRQSLTEVKTPQEYSQEQFLNDFLATPDFAFVPVLGGAGTGKSHLIRWLATKILQMPSDKERRVLLIPRSGTNLRDIIERILSVMDGPKADEYRTRLDKATSSLKEQEARSLLLSNLASQIQFHTSDDGDEAIQFIGANLPALLLDWHFREHLLKDNEIVDRLVTHIIGHREGIEVVEERRRFTISDLPLNVDGFQKAGQAARDLYGLLIATPEYHQITVNLLNEHLDSAIARMLQLNREDLEHLMREVRETLAEENVELILLIEDFAKLQGIDRQVLAAVIERPEEPGKKRQCALRTALGCTVGYFDSLVGTVRQRTTFSVSLDVSEANLVEHENIMTFVARYLNAARVSEFSLLDWYQQSVGEDGQSNDLVPNQCKSCPYHDPCHESFGASKGFGIYPFTSKSIERMLERINRGRFNPRLLIKDVLRHILENYAEALSSGEFPPPSLAHHFGGLRLGANLRLQLDSVDPLNSARRQVLLDLWTNGNALANLDPQIHEAFDLPVLSNTVQVSTKETSVQPIKKTGIVSSAELPSRTQDYLDKVDKWSNGALLPQQVAQELRTIIFPAVIERIAWDTELLLRGKFVGTSGKIFRNANISFHNAVTNTKSAYGVELIVGRDGHNLIEEAVALQALLRYQHYGHWNYPGGTVDFRTYAGRLEIWSDSVLKQIRRRSRLSGVSWDPVPSVTELLAIGVRMAGFPRTGNYNLNDLVDVLFNSYEITSAGSRSNSWKELFKVFCDNREELIEILKAYIPCTKGGHSRLQVIDAVQLIEPLKNIRRTWKPQTTVPPDLRNDLNIIQKVREKVDNLLPIAIIDEKLRHSAWLTDTSAMMGGFENRTETIQLLRTAIMNAKDSGDYAGGGTNSEDLLKVIESFQNSNFNNCIAAINRTIQAIDHEVILEELSRIPQETMSKTENFLQKTKAFLSNSASRVDSRIEGLRNSGADELESTQREIQNILERISQITTELGGQS